MTAHNDITGDAIQTKTSSDAYRDGWDRIFGKKKEEEPVFHLRSYGDVSKEDLNAYTAPADELRAEWLRYCADIQADAPTPLQFGNLIPTFEQWRKLTGR